MNAHDHLSWHCDQCTSSELYRRRFKGVVGALFLKRQNGLILSFLGDLRGKRILDVGAGHGQIVGALRDAGASVTAYGSSEEALERVAPLGIACRVGPLYPLPFGDREFDAVVSVRTFSHVPDWKTFLVELCRVARCAVCFDFVPAGLGSAFKPLLYRLKMKKEPGTRDFALQKRAEIEGIARGAGFLVKRSEGQFVLPMLAHRLARVPVLMPVEHLARMARVTRYFGGPVIMLLERSRE